MQDLVGVGRRGFRLAVGVGVGFVQAAVFVVKAVAVVRVVSHREGCPADGQEEQKRDVPGPVGSQTAVGGQRRAERIHLVEKSGAFLGIFAALHGGLQKITACQRRIAAVRAAVTDQIHRGLVARGLLGDPIHGQLGALHGGSAALGVPGLPVGGIVQKHVDEHGGIGQQCGAAVGLLFLGKGGHRLRRRGGGGAFGPGQLRGITLHRDAGRAAAQQHRGQQQSSQFSVHGAPLKFPERPCRRGRPAPA